MGIQTFKNGSINPWKVIPWRKVNQLNGKKIFLYISVLILYMFRATKCSSSRDWIVSIGIGVNKYKKKNCVSCWLFTKIVIRCTANKIYKVFKHIAVRTQIIYLLYHEIQNILNNLLKCLLACGNVSVLSFRRYNLPPKMLFLRNNVGSNVSNLCSTKCLLSQGGNCVLNQRSLSFVKSQVFVVKKDSAILAK